MKTKLLLTLCVLIVSISSCIKDEPLNREADILEIIVDDDTFIDRSISDDNRIELLMSEEADLSKITPIITITEGATISPASGEVVDLSYGKEVVYTVTAQDKKYSKQYKLKVGEIKLKYSFDEWTTAGSVNYPYPVLVNPMWSNANTGVVLAKQMGVTVERYPTEGTENCVSGGYAANLQTQKGGFLETIKKYISIFPGNLLLGDFSANPFSPLKSLKLGRNHPKNLGKPVIFKGYYKYTPGETMTDPNGNPIPGIDQMSMYAAIFRVTKGAPLNKEFLDGETILTSERVIARAEWEKGSEGLIEKPAINGYTEFSIPFKYITNIDYDKYDYRLTIVCSSSKDGNFFIGAVGSELLVDEFEIVCEPIE